MYVVVGTRSFLDDTLSVNTWKEIIPFVNYLRICTPWEILAQIDTKAEDRKLFVWRLKKEAEKRMSKFFEEK